MNVDQIIAEIGTLTSHKDLEKIFYAYKDQGRKRDIADSSLFRISQPVKFYVEKHGIMEGTVESINGSG